MFLDQQQLLTLGISYFYSLSFCFGEDCAVYHSEDLNCNDCIDRLLS